MFGLIPACLWILALIVNDCSGQSSWVGPSGTTYTKYHICEGGPLRLRCWYNSAHPFRGCCSSGTYSSADCCISYTCPMGNDLIHRCDHISYERCCPIAPGYSTCCNSAGWTAYLSSSSRSSWLSSSRSSSLSSSMSSSLSNWIGYSSSRYWSSVYSTKTTSLSSSCSSVLSDYSTNSFSSSLSQSRSYSSVCSRSSRFWSNHFSTSCQSSRETVTAGCSNGGHTGATNGGSTGGSTGGNNGGTIGGNNGGSTGGSTGGTNGKSNGNSTGGAMRGGHIGSSCPPETPCSNTGLIVGGTLAGFFFLVMVVVAAVMGSQLAAHRSQSGKNPKSPRRPLSGFENVIYNDQVPVGTSQEDQMNVYAELQLPPNGQSRY